MAMGFARFLFVSWFVCTMATAAPAQVHSKIADSDFGRELSDIVRTSRDAATALPRLEGLSRWPGLDQQQRMQVDGMRVRALSGLKQHAEAQTIAKAIVDTQPDLPDGHLILANAAFAAEDFPATAKALMAASLLQPDIVNQLPAYEIQLLAHQLKTGGERELLAAFAQRFFDAGWDKGNISTRSTLARDLILSLIEKGQVRDATRYLPLIVSPASYASIIADKRFAPIRAAVEEWAGPRLEKQWPIYLEKTRRAWLADRTQEAAADYVTALDLAGHNRTIVATFAPELSRAFEPREDELWIFVFPTVTRALAALGRWDEAFALLDRADKTWPAAWGANSINISGNRARLRLLKGDFEAAARLFSAVLDQAKPVALQVTPQTMANLKGYQLCAQHQMGGGDTGGEAERLAAKWGKREPANIAWVQLCLGQRDQALKTLISALQDDEGREATVGFMQPKSDTTVDSDFARKMAEAIDSLSRDPALVEAARQYGERRTWKLRDSAPPEGRVADYSR
jgi:tetratricopeptide (TPR) repeat protein